MTQKQRTYFIACKVSGRGWRNGNPDPIFEFVESSTPEDALNKFWELEVEEQGHKNAYDYRAEVHADANDYHNHKKPLASRSYYAEEVCHNPDCPYC